MDAIEKTKGTLFAIASGAKGTQFDGVKTDAMAVTDGRIHLKEKSPDSGVPFEEILVKGNIRVASGQGSSKGTFGDPNKKFSLHSFGAQFAEVTWQPETARPA